MTLLRACFTLLSVALATLASAAPDAAPADAAKALETPPGIVDGKTARALVAAGAVIVDVRTPEEFAAAHVAGARNIPHDQIARRAAELGHPATPILLYCRTGRRSGIASEELKKLGYQKVWDMQVLERWDEKAQ